MKKLMNYLLLLLVVVFFITSCNLLLQSEDNSGGDQDTNEEESEEESEQESEEEEDSNNVDDTSDNGSDSGGIVFKVQGTQLVFDSDPEIELEDTIVGYQEAVEIKVENSSEDPLRVETLFELSGADGFSCALRDPADDTEIVLDQYDFFYIVVTFSPEEPGLQTAELTVSSDDATRPEATITLRATGTDRGRLELLDTKAILPDPDNANLSYFLGTTPNSSFVYFKQNNPEGHESVYWLAFDEALGQLSTSSPAYLLPEDEDGSRAYPGVMIVPDKWGETNPYIYMLNYPLSPSLNRYLARVYSVDETSGALTKTGDLDVGEFNITGTESDRCLDLWFNEDNDIVYVLEEMDVSHFMDPPEMGFRLRGYVMDFSDQMNLYANIHVPDAVASSIRPEYVMFQWDGTSWEAEAPFNTYGRYEIVDNNMLTQTEIELDGPDASGVFVEYYETPDGEFMYRNRYDSDQGKRVMDYYQRDTVSQDLSYLYTVTLSGEVETGDPELYRCWYGNRKYQVSPDGNYLYLFANQKTWEYDPTAEVTGDLLAERSGIVRYGRDPEDGTLSEEVDIYYLDGLENEIFADVLFSADGRHVFFIGGVYGVENSQYARERAPYIGVAEAIY